MGYFMTSKAYRFLNLETPSPHTVVESINVELFDNTFTFQKSKKIVGVREPKSSNKQKNECYKQVEPPNSTKERKSKGFGPIYVVCLVEGDPLSCKETMSSHDAIFWKEAIDDNALAVSEFLRENSD